MSIEIKIGDEIKFRAFTRLNSQSARRLVTGFWQGKPTVRFQGMKDFVVRWHEISEVNNIPTQPSGARNSTEWGWVDV